MSWGNPLSEVEVKSQTLKIPQTKQQTKPGPYLVLLIPTCSFLCQQKTVHFEKYTVSLRWCLQLIFQFFSILNVFQAVQSILFTWNAVGCFFAIP